MAGAFLGDGLRKEIWCVPLLVYLQCKGLAKPGLLVSLESFAWLMIWMGLEG
ncbi:MAG: hypothetical protein N3G20_04060 [Verrucomicrobiae bacterium]|nr:hypothetical protein [Verrucomicrobiae bacterium]